MCNACVLIVKRWRKLPRTSKKDWAHIVDAKGAGCVGKSSGRKKIEDSEEKLHKIRRKFKVKPKISRKLEFPREPKSANIKNLISNDTQVSTKNIKTVINYEKKIQNRVRYLAQEEKRMQAKMNVM